ncbi:hypothetical protein BST27_14440 [Mycobacterium intermedium]|uniref:DUF7159 domain-containing protein n=1 Tax=Mycobacterium intermedium TaxID=28445 RepID=A0A1E3SIF5_MYCIE|nr:hypothetical protein [Mycobacterium intermedium]MCV6964313.1 hypothetical protein [Mycobacterium intermedium]ODR01927.1 hypothetical protein BHQ20_06695 [Mycobacterium intermedium]OPE51018.1 hypothetical protein BV508_08130 [Mycobacterium intermedium]ORB04216.1 hypothetical protein BST27_14440 [Mycobacterium intermedium]
MDTVLGLSVTPTALGWVLAEGHGADGTIVDHQEIALDAGGGVRAVSTAEQVAAEVLRASSVAAESDHRLRVIGVTWNDEASAQAALLLEALTDAGFDNVVPVRMLNAVETLAKAIAPVIGYERTAVCILEQDWATVAMVDTHDGEVQTAVKHVRGGFDGLSSWLTGMFDRSAWRPAGVVVVGSDNDVAEFSWQLEKALPVPVFAQTMAQVTIARGAALAAAQSTEFTDEGLVATAVEPAVEPTRSRSLSYAGAATTLAAAAVTFVASVSLAIGLQVFPEKDRGPADHRAHEPKPPVAEAVAPTPPPAPQHAGPPSVPVAVSPPPVTQEPIRLAADEQAEEAAADEPPSGVLSQTDPNNPLQLTRVLDHIPGTQGDLTESPPE